LRLILIGPGEPAELDTLSRLAQSLGVGDQVGFGGATAVPEQILPGFDVVVMPSRFEGFSLSLLEALANGRPTISSDVGAATQVIEDGKSGWLVRPNDQAHLEARLGEVLRLSPDQRAIVGNAARAQVRNSYDATRRFDEFASAIANHPKLHRSTP
jgi:glycosyltransferase involved in cell wall biosynthesis